MRASGTTIRNPTGTALTENSQGVTDFLPDGSDPAIGSPASLRLKPSFIEPVMASLSDENLDFFPLPDRTETPANEALCLWATRVRFAWIQSVKCCMTSLTPYHVIPTSHWRDPAP